MDDVDIEGEEDFVACCRYCFEIDMEVGGERDLEDHEFLRDYLIKD